MRHKVGADVESVKMRPASKRFSQRRNGLSRIMVSKTTARAVLRLRPIANDASAFGGKRLVAWLNSKISISTATACAKNAASSAFLAIPTPPPSPRSVCMPCSTVVRRRPASSPMTASASTPSAAWPGRRQFLQGFDDSATARRPRHRPCALFDNRRNDFTQCPALVRRARFRRLRARP